jgi:hypothetical protein
MRGLRRSAARPRSISSWQAVFGSLIVTLLRLNRISSSSGRWASKSILRSVDLPAPLWPTITSTSPEFRDSEPSFTACRPPKALLIGFISTTASGMQRSPAFSTCVHRPDIKQHVSAHAVVEFVQIHCRIAMRRDAINDVAGTRAIRRFGIHDTAMLVFQELLDRPRRRTIGQVPSMAKAVNLKARGYSAGLMTDHECLWRVCQNGSCFFWTRSNFVPGGWIHLRRTEVRRCALVRPGTQPAPHRQAPCPRAGGFSSDQLWCR